MTRDDSGANSSSAPRPHPLSPFATVCESEYGKRHTNHENQLHAQLYYPLRTVTTLHLHMQNV